MRPVKAAVSIAVMQQVANLFALWARGFDSLRRRKDTNSKPISLYRSTGVSCKNQAGVQQTNGVRICVRKSPADTRIIGSFRFNSGIRTK